MTGFNLPAGVRPGDLPGNRPEDDRAERAKEQVLDGLEADVRQAFERQSLPEWMVETALDAIWMDEKLDAYVEERLPDGYDEIGGEI